MPHPHGVAVRRRGTTRHTLVTGVEGGEIALQAAQDEAQRPRIHHPWICAKGPNTVLSAMLMPMLARACSPMLSPSIPWQKSLRVDCSPSSSRTCTPDKTGAPRESRPQSLVHQGDLHGRDPRG